MRFNAQSRFQVVTIQILEGAPMRTTPRFFSCLASILVFTFCCACALYAQAPATASAPATPGASILPMVQRFEANFMAAAQAMPADKYSFAPSDADVFKAGSPAKFATVRTFAQQITHVTGEALRNLAPFGVKQDTGVDLKTLDGLTDKEQILKALKASFDYQDKVVASITPENAFAPTGPRGSSVVSMLIAVMNDDGDHYGQMVEYLRMNGIIPPSTERQMQQQAKPAAVPAK